MNLHPLKIHYPPTIFARMGGFLESNLRRSKIRCLHNADGSLMVFSEQNTRVSVAVDIGEFIEITDENDNFICGSGGGCWLFVAVSEHAPIRLRFVASLASPETPPS
jgi:hypothetical protein